MMDDFERGWLDLVKKYERFEALYALIGMTRLGERPTTVGQLAAALRKSKEEATRLAWEAARVRPDDEERFHVETPFAGASPRRRLVVGDREIPVSGCAPDLFGVAAVVDVPFRVDDTCSVTGVPIRIGFVPGSVERVEPAEAVVVMLSPVQAAAVSEMEIEQINTNLCVQQPFFSSAQAVRSWLDSHEGGRVLPVEEMPRQPWVTYIREHWRPRILVNAA